MKRPSRPTSVSSNRELWSEESKRSYSYQSSIAEYKDYHYECMHCKQPSIFTAQDQKKTYEVRKAYIWQRRTLCSECFRARVETERDLEARAASWKADRQSLSSDKQFLLQWLAALEKHVSLGGRADTGNMNMLQKLLASNEA
jgi:Probable zinc-ribbon domain